MTEITDKICCVPCSTGNNDALMASMLNSQNQGANNWMNNPFVYLVWMMFANRMWGGESGQNTQNAELQNQLSAMRTQMSTDQNTNLLMDGIKGSDAAIQQLAGNLNCDFNSLKDSCCAINAGVQNVAGQVGFSAERVINAANLGDCNIISALKDCCCTTQKAIIEQNSENRLSICQQTNALQNSITGGNYALTNTINNGFNSLTMGLNNLSFQNQQQSCDIRQGITAATQAIKDMLGNHWAQDLRDKNFQYSQDAQTNYIINQLKTTATP